MKNLFLFLIFILTVSCDREYDGEKRIQFKGKVVDEFNQPLPNQSVKIYSTYDENFVDVDMIGIGKTDSNGDYSIVVPQAKSFSYSVNINEDVFLTSEFTNTRFVNIKNSDILNYSYQLPSAKLFLYSNLSNLHVTFSNTNISNELKSVEFIGDVANEYINVNNDLVDSNYSKKVKKNQTIEIKYKVFDHTNQTTTTYSSFVLIDSSDHIYQTINY